MSKIDVIVLGTGIAGCSAASLLAAKGYGVCLVSPNKETKHHLPESWIINFPSYISDFGIEEKLRSSFSYQNQCVFCSDDSVREMKISLNNRTEQFSSGELVNVNRDAFDRILFENALQSGANFIQFNRLVNLHFSEEGIQLDIEVNEEVQSLHASYIIDASGKSCLLNHKLKIPIEETLLDHRLACFSHFELSGEPLDCMRIISIENGYIFVIPTFSGRVSIGCVVEDSSILRNAEQIFLHALSQSNYLANLIKNSKQLLPYIPIKNVQRVCSKPIGNQYSVIGDAAIFMDPFFCPGIDFAFFSAEQAVLAYESKSPEHYHKHLKRWIKESSISVYEKIERSQWKMMIRLFSDPHQPFLIPLFITQALGQVTGTHLSLKDGITLARETYAANVH